MAYSLGCVNVAVRRPLQKHRNLSHSLLLLSPDIEPDIGLAHGRKQPLERAHFRTGNIVIFRCTAKVQAAASEVNPQPFLYEPGKFLFGIQDAFCLLLCQKAVHTISRCDEIDGVAFVQS
jgi:hypothetical protein